MKVIDTTTTTYDMGDGFRLDIVKDWSDEHSEAWTYEAWVYHKDYGVKKLMFGCKYHTGYGIFDDMAKGHFEEYRGMYKDEVMYALTFN